MPNPIDVVEALLFASDVPLEAERIREVLDLENAAAARELVAELMAALRGRAARPVDRRGGRRLPPGDASRGGAVAGALARARTRVRLSRPALETLAIVAYKQPVSRPELDAVRGVNSDAVLDNLLERRLIRIAGRKDSPGRPFLYETTREFLVAFGLRDVGDLPKVDGELVIPDARRRRGGRLAGEGHGQADRLSKILAQAGLSSRRGAERLVARGSRRHQRRRDAASSATLADPDADRHRRGRARAARARGQALSAPPQAARRT